MRIEKAVSQLKTKFPDISIFGNSIEEREIDKNRSLFFYLEPKEYFRGDGGKGMYNNFYLTYMTREEKDIDILQVIDAMTEGTGLTFVDSSEERARLEGTEQMALAVTMRFTYLVRLCHGS